MVKVCDCFPELKDITDARERRYRAHPDKAAPEGPQSYVEVKVTSIGQLNELVEAKRSGHKFIISEPVHVGGQNVRAHAARVPALRRGRLLRRGVRLLRGEARASPTTASRRLRARASTCAAT